MYCIQYNRLDDNLKTMVKNSYPNVDFAYNYIAYKYSQLNDEYTICGFFSIEEKNITTSPLLNSILSANTAYDEHSNIEDFKNIECFCITNLEIGNNVTKEETKDIFQHIALILAKEINTIIVWLEHKGNLLFYNLTYDPNAIFGYPSFAEYFASNLIS